MAQAAILGQTFGMLSGNSNDLLMTQSFHGTVISWARQAEMFRVTSWKNQPQNHDSGDVEAAWKRWAHTEETMRLILGLYIHDSEFTTLFHTEPFLRHDQEKLPRCCADDLSVASTAQRWNALMNRTSTGASSEANGSARATEIQSMPREIPQSRIFASTVLCGIIASIREAKTFSRNDTWARSYYEKLQEWSRTWLGKQNDARDDNAHLMLLWHEAFITLYTDIDLLERAIGRDGKCEELETLNEVSLWAASLDARRCVLHAGMALKCAESGTLKTEPAIHVPKTLFHAGLAIYSYLKFSSSLYTHDNTENTEFQVGEFEWLTSMNSAKACLNMLQATGFSSITGLADVLRRIGHWELSRKFASILEILINDLTVHQMENGLEK